MVESGIGSSPLQPMKKMLRVVRPHLDLHQIELAFSEISSGWLIDIGQGCPVQSDLSF
jgi:hypothetical protein